MKKKTFLLFIIFRAFFCHAQSFTLSGYISDSSSGEKLINATIFETSLLKGSVSNIYGFYSLTLPSGSREIRISYVGYQPVELVIKLNRDTVVNFGLQPAGVIGEVTVVGNKSDQSLKSSQMSRMDIAVEKIQQLPALFGEADVIKAIQLLPGVQSGSEGTTGLYVRGGGPDQNLILIDGVPVYNAEHLFGFFSVFNPDAINSVSLYKGGFPARFGGRLSSVLDIRMKEGNLYETHGRVSVGLIASKINVEGPVMNGKTAYNFSFRRTYLDILARPVLRLIDKNGNDGGYYFYDMNAKINHCFSDKSRLYLSFYSGNDKAFSNLSDLHTEDGENLEDKIDFNLGWGNITTALRWNYLFSNKLFSNTTLTFSNYDFNVEQKYSISNLTSTLTNLYHFNYRSGIRDFALKFDADYYPVPEHSVKAGFNVTAHEFKPGVRVININESVGMQSFSVDTLFGDKKIKATELYGYIEDDLEVTSRLQANLGLHVSGFAVNQSFYTSLEPRISARYLFSNSISLKASVASMAQYIHLLSTSTINLPTDLWLPVTDRVKPQKSLQIAMGGVWQISEGVSFSNEYFVKRMKGLIEYKEGASFFGSTEGWEDKIETGEGTSYGSEFLLEKTSGKTTGWIGYTLSKADRKFPGLNYGLTFPARYDRRHDVSLVATHRLNDRIDFGLTWVYGTGNAVTLATQRFPAQLIPYSNRGNEDIEFIGDRNNYRMPAYHRLDFSANFHKRKKHGTRTWNISLYNAYSRQNPFFLYFGYDDGNNRIGDSNDNTAENSKRVLKQVSLFPVIPSVTYSYTF